MLIPLGNRTTKLKSRKNMRVGIATDHGGFGSKEEMVAQLRADSL
jgi:hypothetical protein